MFPSRGSQTLRYTRDFASLALKHTAEVQLLIHYKIPHGNKTSLTRNCCAAVDTTEIRQKERKECESPKSTVKQTPVWNRGCLLMLLCVGGTSETSVGSAGEVIPLRDLQAGASLQTRGTAREWCRGQPRTAPQMDKHSSPSAHCLLRECRSCGRAL